MLRELLTATYGDPPFPPRVVGWLRLDRVGELDVDEPCPECGLPMDEVWAGLLDNGQWVGPRCPLCAATEP